MNTRTLPNAVQMCFALLFALSISISAVAQQKVEIKADSLKIESEQRTARFTGNVRATIDGMRFYCGKMTVIYDANGSVVSLKASGKVTVMKNGAKAVAERAVMNVASGKIVLTGNPRLTREGNTLTGKTIEVDIQSGKIEVTEAVGTFVFSKGVSPGTNR